MIEGSKRIFSFTEAMHKKDITREIIVIIILMASQLLFQIALPMFL